MIGAVLEGCRGRGVVHDRVNDENAVGKEGAVGREGAVAAGRQYAHDAQHRCHGQTWIQHITPNHG